MLWRNGPIAHYHASHQGPVTVTGWGIRTVELRPPVTVTPRTTIFPDENLVGGPLNHILDTIY